MRSTPMVHMRTLNGTLKFRVNAWQGRKAPSTNLRWLHRFLPKKEEGGENFYIVRESCFLNKDHRFLRAFTQRFCPKSATFLDRISLARSQEQVCLQPMLPGIQVIVEPPQRVQALVCAPLDNRAA